MKYLLIITLLIGSAQAQTKRDNTIIVHGVTLGHAVDKLLDAGYSIDRADKDFGYASTKPDITGQIIHLRIKDSAVLVTSEILVSGMKIPILYFKTSQRWKDMQKYAESLGGQIDYAKVNN